MRLSKLELFVLFIKIKNLGRGENKGGSIQNGLSIAECTRWTDTRDDHDRGTKTGPERNRTGTETTGWALNVGCNSRVGNSPKVIHS